jgi:hypothetical protein
MLWSVTLGVAMSVVAAACALVEPPPPTDTRPFQAQVQNPHPNPAGLTITTPAGVLPGAVRPASVPAFSETIVTFHVPISGEWAFAVNGDDQLGFQELNPNIGVCLMKFVLGGDDSSFSCLPAP